MMSRFLFILGIALASLSARGDPSARVYPLHLDKSYRQDYTNTVARDPSGFLWIGTDSGLKRYDGYTLQAFAHDPENPTTLGTPNINAILVQKDGTLWVAGNNLNRYNPNTDTFTRYGINDFKDIRCLHEDTNGNIWVGGDQLGLLLFDPKKGVVLRHFFNETDPPLNIYSIVPRKRSTQLWLGTNKGLFLFDLQTMQAQKAFEPTNAESFRPMMLVTEDRDGDVWISSREGLYRFNPATTHVLHYAADSSKKGALTTNALTAIATDTDGNIWVGSDKHGLFRYVAETDSFQHYPPSAYDKYRLPPADITRIFDDGQGSIWLAAGNYGVFRFSPHLQKFKSFQHSFDTVNSLGFNMVSTIHEDKKGFIWLGTDGGGVDRFDPRTYEFRHFRHDPNNPHTLGSDAVISIAEDSQGYIWLGTWAGGLNRLDPQTGDVLRFLRDPKLPLNKTLTENHIFRIVVMKDDRLLLAVGGSGLQIFDPRSGDFQTFLPDQKNLSHGLRSDYINDILPAPNGDYWIAGYKGLERFSPAKGRVTTPNITINDAIYDLHSDGEGLLWIATSRGLVRFNPISEESARFNLKDGLSDETIVGIEQDGNRFLWLATRNGLNRFDPISKEVESFDEEDGLVGVQFNRFSHMKTKDGLIYFGTNQGFSFFDPMHMPRNEFAPALHFTGLNINHEPQHPGQSQWLKHTIGLTTKLVLPSTADDIRLWFTATNFISPSKNQYRYRLLGQSNEWLSVSSDQRSTLYSNLPAGEYELQLLATNNDGVWAGAAKKLSIVILPAWWQTWWAYMIYVILFLLTIYGFSIWRVHVSNKRARELELLVNEQTTKLKAANRAVSQLNSELEQRVAQRTHALSAEIEERKESEAKATFIAYHDTLSGLYNRAWLLQQLEKCLKEGSFALLFVGGDRFRKINDTYGHRLGDKVLIATGEKLRGLCPESAHVIRMGSDEFAVLLESFGSEENMEKLAEAIAAAFREPFLIDQIRLNFTVSIGLVFAEPGRYTEPSQLLRNANIAMQKAKDRGRGVWQKFDDKILQETLTAAELESDLKMALPRQQFSVVYQPIIAIDSCHITGFEVLIRWRHPEKGMIPPDKFIGMAEASGLIFDIGFWVLEQACQQLKTWQTVYKVEPLPTVAVNLSPIQLERSDFLERVDEVIGRSGINPNNIKFEITESALLQHTETVDDILEALRERKIELAIDDFGTGYSSLSYLDKLPVQVLKIDRSFVNALTDQNKNNSGAHEIVRATISLAHNLNMRIVAEGIETQQQMAILKEYGCDFGQGYLIARPLPPEQATELLTASVGRIQTP